jgi:hypothetical protein
MIASMFDLIDIDYLLVDFDVES